MEEPNANGVEVTIAIPSYNQGEFIGRALKSVFSQDVVSEICIADGGSTDNSVEIISRNSSLLHWWQSKADSGQSNAINIAIAKGDAPYVCWLNSDDMFSQGALRKMVDFLEENPECPMVYGKSWLIDSNDNKLKEYKTHHFSSTRLAKRCFISQPATLIRRSVWDGLGGLNESFQMSMDFDLWWRVYKQFGPLGYLSEFVAFTRIHGETKTSTRRKEHYTEAMALIKHHYGSVPLIWYFKWPWSVWYKSFKGTS
ncbi:MAG: GT2 family glycosyltransferase [Candidatus Azotimanducaceae bacterium]|jgi:GT2 family glycosyltransferase